MENRKNSILLTVIAVATLLVAVVGATFAYFTAQGGNTAQTNINVTTGTSDSSSFGTWTAINITADQETFAQGKGNRVGTSTGSASFTANSTEAADFCYNVALDVTTNTFVYSSTNTEQVAELTLTAEKDGVKLIDGVDITTAEAGTNVVRIPNAVGGTDYEHKIHAEAGKTVNNAWTLTVTLVNLDVDQNDNAGKTFAGAVKFTKVECATAGA